MSPRSFTDRAEAGRALAERLSDYAHEPGLIVLGLPRGGVPVGVEVAEALGAPMDIFLVRKLGLPGQEELAMGAIASGGGRVLNDEVLNQERVSEADLARVTAREQLELARREQHYRGDRAPLQVRDRCVILVDDGMATGASMRAALAALREQQPRCVVAAVPVASEEAVVRLRAEADRVVSVITPGYFMGVGRWYLDFTQVPDAEVTALLARAWSRPLARPAN